MNISNPTSPSLYKKILPITLFFIVLASFLFFPALNAHASFWSGFQSAMNIGSGPNVGLPLAAGNNVISIIFRVINLIFALVSTIALFAIIWGGIMYILALGDESRVAKAKRILLYAIIGLIIVLLGQAIVIAVVCTIDPDASSSVIFPGTSSSCSEGAAAFFGGVILRIIQFIMGPAAVIAFGALVYGGYMFIIAGPSGDEKKAAKGKQVILYAFIGLAIIGISGVVVNALLKLVLPAP